MPGTKRIGRPISVARPTASSTASNPAILRIFMGTPLRASRMNATIDPQMMVAISASHPRSRSKILLSTNCLRVASPCAGAAPPAAQAVPARTRALRTTIVRISLRIVSPFNELHISTRNHNSLPRFELHLEDTGLRARAEHSGLVRQPADRTDQPEVRVTDDPHRAADLQQAIGAISRRLLDRLGLGDGNKHLGPHHAGADLGRPVHRG